jgi:hypothetical protein
VTYRTPELSDLRHMLVAHDPQLVERTTLRLWRNRSKNLWYKLAEADPQAATWLSAYVAALAGPPPRIAGDRPDRYYTEQADVMQLSGDKDDRDRLLLLLDRLWDLVPYGVDGAARIEALRYVRPHGRSARRDRDEVVALAVVLGERTTAEVALARLPAGLRGCDDGPMVPSADLARRLTSAHPSDLDAFLRVLSDERLVHIAGYYGAAGFLRRLARSSSVAVRILLLSDYLSLRRLPTWGTLTKTWDVVDELCERLGRNDADPLAARRGGPRVVVTDEALDALEVVREIDYARRSLNGQPPRSAWDACYRGCAGLREALRLVDPERDHIVIERLPSFPAPQRAARGHGVEDDAVQLDLDTQAELFIVGLRVLAGEPEELRTWVVLWSTMCRPKESGPAAWDFVPLGSAYVIYRERRAAKGGRVERYVSSAACEVTGIGPAWFPPGPEQHPRSDADYERQTRLADAACRKVREAWQAEGRGELPDRTAYLVRKAGADRLRWGLAGRFYALTRVLGHLSEVSDWTYTFVSSSELDYALATVAKKLGGILP